MLKRHYGFKETHFEDGQSPALDFSVPALAGHAEDEGEYVVPGTTLVRFYRFQRSKVVFSGALRDGRVTCLVPHVCRVVANHSATTIQLAYRRWGNPTLLMPPF